jgi:BolA family transcriptional regulator, general stress-responsive regulator
MRRATQGLDSPAQTSLRRTALKMQPAMAQDGAWEVPKDMTMGQTPTTVETEIRRRLLAGLDPTRLEIINESHLHAGHRDAPGTGDSHFRLLVVSAKFAGLNRVARQRLVNDLLADLMNKPIHALAMKAVAPGEAG